MPQATQIRVVKSSHHVNTNPFSNLPKTPDIATCQCWEIGQPPWGDVWAQENHLDQVFIRLVSKAAAVFNWDTPLGQVFEGGEPIPASSPRKNSLFIWGTFSFQIFCQKDAEWFAFELSPLTSLSVCRINRYVLLTLKIPDLSSAHNHLSSVFPWCRA